MNLKEFKAKYEGLAGKYGLPKFSELNENFEIEKLRKGEETLLRTIRKAMMEKVVNSVGFLEFLLNPINAPRAYLIYIKSMTLDDRKEIESIYSTLSDIMLAALRLEIDYSEEDEAKMIKRIVKDWEKVKPSFRRIIEAMQKPANLERKERSYFG